MSQTLGAAMDGPSALKTLAAGETLRLGSASATVDSAGNISVTSVAETANVADTINGTHGEAWTNSFATELITLSTSGVTTDSVGNLLPANSVIKAVVARVTTTITTATNWELGDATTAGRFSAPNSTLVAGTTQVGTVAEDQTGAAGPRQVATAKLRITTTGTPGAGAIRVTVFYSQFVPPTS